MLEAGARFLGAVDTVTPFNEHAAGSVDDYARYTAPTPGFVEQVYCITPLSGRDGKTEIGLVNRAGDKGVSMSYATDTLPYLTLWKNTPSLGEGYVTGLEPGTNFPNNRRIERQHGRVPKLEGGQSHRASIDFTLLKGQAAIRALEGRIAQIQQQQAPKILRSPEKKD